MRILGKINIQGKEKNIILKQEGELFKYYILELLGAYLPQMAEQEIIFKKETNLTIKDKTNIIKKLKAKNIYQIIQKMIQQHEIIRELGQIEIEEKQKDMILKKEEQYFKYYYLELIGVYTPKMPGETIIFREDTIENAVSANIKETEQKNKISPLEKEQIEQFLERIKIWEIAEKIQMQERGVKEKSQYNKTIKQNTENKKEQQKSQNNKKQQKEQERQEKQPQKIKNKANDINIKQEVDMDTRVTDMHNLNQVLKKNEKMPELEHGDEALKMGIVESDNLKDLKNAKGEKEQGHSSRFEAVVITKKGNIQTLDLENDTQEGTNPTEKNYQVKQNEYVEKSDVLTRLKVGEGSIGIEKAQYGEVEVYHSPRKTIGGNGIEGNKSIDRQLETSDSKNTMEGTDIETLKLAQEHNDGYRSVEDGYQEIEKHDKQHPDCEQKTVKDLDGEKNTQSHIHPEPTEEFVELSNGEKISYSQLATRWGFYKEGKPDSEFVKEKFGEKKKDDKKPEDVIGELDEEFEDPRATDLRR